MPGWIKRASMAVDPEDRAMMLSKALEEGGKSERFEAVKMLGEMGDRNATMVLLRAMVDEEDGVIYRAMKDRLIEKGASILPILSWAMENSSYKVRLAATTVLSDMEAEEALDPLVFYSLLDTNPEVRDQARRGIENHSQRYGQLIKAQQSGEQIPDYIMQRKEKHILGPLKRSLRNPQLVRERVIYESLAKAGIEGVRTVIDAYRNADPETQGLIQKVFRGMTRQEAVDSLVPFVQGDDPLLKTCAIEILRGIGVEGLPEEAGAKEEVQKVSEPPQARPIDEYINAFRKANTNTRLVILERLSGSGAGRFLGVFEMALKDKDRRVRQQAVAILSGMEDGRAVDLLIRALKDPEEDIQLSAIRSLIKIGDKNIIPALLREVKNPHKSVRAAAIAEVSRRARRSYLYAMKVGNEKARRAADRILARLTGEMIKIVTPELKSLEEDIRLSIIEMILEIGSGLDVEPILIKAMTNPNQRYRAAVVRVLGALGDTRAVNILLRALKDPDRRVRANTIEAFEFIGSPSVSSMIEPFLSDPDNRVRANAAKALHRFGSPAGLRTLLTMLKEEDEWMRASGAWALGEIGAKQAKDALVGILNSDPSPRVKVHVSRALKKIQDASQEV
ncbi:MAG: HEAT repeat domain-containing protein [bacterium]